MVLEQEIEELKKRIADLEQRLPKASVLEKTSALDKARLIQEHIIAANKIPLSLLIGRRRDERAVWPRQLAMFLCRETTNLPLECIGALFCKDHGTVMHAVKVVRDRMDTDPVRRVEVNHWLKVFSQEAVS